MVTVTCIPITYLSNNFVNKALAIRMPESHRARVSSRLETLSVNIDTEGGSPFLSSPTGTPKALIRNSDGSYIHSSRLEHIKKALVHNRNELVLLFSR